MTKIDFYCPSCGQTTKQYFDYLAPGPCDFICDNCFTVWSVKIEYHEKSGQGDDPADWPDDLRIQQFPGG